MTTQVTRLTLLVACVATAASFCLTNQARSQAADTPAYQGDDSQASPATLPQNVVDAVWAAIDVNQDGRGTDREAYAAVKQVRVTGNSKEQSELRDNLRKSADKNDDELIAQAEALSLIAKVRGLKCPTAKRAKVFFDGLDKNSNQMLSPEEMRKTLKPLGKVGKALFRPVGITVKGMDLSGDNAIDTDELYLSANAMLRVQLATDGPGIARRDPSDWLRFVQAISYMDVDADNKVSLAEASQISAIGRQFANIDRNRDQHLSPGELCEFQSTLDLQAYLNSAGGVGGS